ncbi:MAG: hypothetical protein C4527_22170 [Candidatus Omnitrophota bacterium]|nr:MAG: hypothetical protein C4527_22170 [Candidatus Omnitrophota bacterium]
MKNINCRIHAGQFVIKDCKTRSFFSLRWNRSLGILRIHEEIAPLCLRFISFPNRKDSATFDGEIVYTMAWEWFWKARMDHEFGV